MMDSTKIKFYHKVRLNDGNCTPGIEDVEKARSTYIFDELDFADKSVLDVGCWDGYFSFEAEKLGASQVVSFDNPACRWGGIDGYVFLHNHFRSRAHYVQGSVYDLRNIFLDKEFDIVLCYGVLYHLSDPLFALQNLFHVCNEIVVFEGHFSEEKKPCLELIPHKSFNEDGGNLYRPSISYMELIGEYNGFKLEKMSKSVERRLNLLFKRVSDKVIYYSDTSFSQYESK